MVQTPEQRKRNAKFVKAQDAARGKSESDLKKKEKRSFKSPINPVIAGLLIFVVVGGLLFDPIARFLAYLSG